MNSRERVMMALNHKEPDRIPCDFSSNTASSIHVEAYRKLRKYLGLPDDEAMNKHKTQHIVDINDELHKKLGGDTGCIPSFSSGFQIEIKDDMPGYSYYYDQWGIGWRKPIEGGFHYNTFHHPLANAMNKEDIDKHAWPDPTDPDRFEGLKNSARHILKDKNKAAVLECPGSGIMEQTPLLFSWERFYTAIINELDLLTYLMDKIIDFKLRYWEIALHLLGEDVDVVIESDDLGAQHAMLISPQTYRSVIKPRHKHLYSFIKARTNAKLFLHSDGAIRPIIPDLIEVGVDILNPIQVTAKDMDAKELKKEFGNDLVLWGGLELQDVLEYNNPVKVRNEVKRRIDDFAAGGGFVAAARIPADMPPESIVEMWETLREYGTYS